MRRSSSSASRQASSAALTLVRTGSIAAAPLSRSSPAATHWTTATVRLCATTSCISRAILVRSTATASAADRACSASACRARPANSRWACVRRLTSSDRPNKALQNPQVSRMSGRPLPGVRDSTITAWASPQAHPSQAAHSGRSPPATTNVSRARPNAPAGSCHPSSAARASWPATDTTIAIAGARRRASRTSPHMAETSAGTGRPSVSSSASVTAVTPRMTTSRYRPANMVRTTSGCTPMTVTPRRGGVLNLQIDTGPPIPIFRPTPAQHHG